MVDYKQLARNTMWVYIISFLIMPIGFLIRMMYARELSVADYGLFYGLFAFFGVFAFLTDFGLIGSSYYFLSKYIANKDASKIKTLFFLNQGLQLILSLLIGLILFLLKGFIIAKFYPNEAHIGFMFDLFIIWWILQPIKVANLYFFTYFQEQKISRSLELIEMIFVLGLSFIGFFFFESFRVPIYAYLATMIMMSIISTVLLYYFHKEFFHAPFYLKKDLMKEVFDYTMLLMPTTILSIFMVQMDILVIQYFKGAEQVAYYSSGFGIASLMIIFTMPLTLILLPLMANLWHKNDKERLSKIISFFVNNVLLLLLPFSLFFFVFSDAIIEISLTSKFLPASIILKILVLAYLIKIFTTIFFSMLPLFGEPKKTSTLLAIIVPIGFLLDIISVIYFGIVGVAIANVLFFLLMLILFYREVSKLIKIKIEFMTNLKIVISSAAFILVCFLLRGKINVVITSIHKLDFIISGGLIFIIAFTSYLLALFAFGVINKDKINLFKELLLKREGNR